MALKAKKPTKQSKPKALVLSPNKTPDLSPNNYLSKKRKFSEDSGSGRLTRTPFMPRSKQFGILHEIENRNDFPIYDVLSFVLLRSKESKKVFSLSYKEKRLLGRLLFKKADSSFSNREFENCLFYLVTIYSCFANKEGKRLECDETTDRLRLVEDVINSEIKFLKINEFQNKLSDSIVFYSLLKMGKCFNRLGNFKEARECLDKAAEFDKNSVRLLYLFARNTIDDSSIDMAKINQSLSYLKKTREALNKRKNELNKKEIAKFERNIEDLSKDIKKKKKTAEKKRKLNLNRIISGTLEKVCDKRENRKDSNFCSSKEVLKFLTKVSEQYLKELRYYHKNRNYKFLQKTKKEFYEFMTIKEEIVVLLNFPFDLKNLKTNNKKKVLSILDKNKNKKTEFITVFEEEKLRLANGLIKKIKGNCIVAEYVERTDCMMDAVNTKLKELKVKEFKKKYRDLFSTLDCSFLLFFSVFAVLFLSFISEL